jgi:hypothetical protein
MTIGDQRSMAFSLHDASVSNFIQTLQAVSGFLSRSLMYLQESRLDPEEMVETRLFTDMRPFRFQIVSIAHHSRGAIDGIRRGVFSPEMGAPDLSYSALQKMIREAHESLASETADSINSLIGRKVLFKAADLELPFIAEDFLMSFSLPNFYFHAATAYDLLRYKGVPLGKRDFIGQMRVRR